MSFNKSLAFQELPPAVPIVPRLFLRSLFGVGTAVLGLWLLRIDPDFSECGPERSEEFRTTAP